MQINTKMRFVPAAMTPIRFRDLSYGLTQYMKKDALIRFEDAIKSFLKVGNSCTSTSFMKAIHACLNTLKKIDGRREVVLPRYSCPSFVHAVLESGLKIRYCDIDPTTLSIDIDSVDEMNLQNVLAIICVNHFGFANPMDKIMDLCGRNDIYLIEDLGYGLGTEFRGGRLGSFGDFSVLNFQEGKAIPVGGGMVTTDHEGIMDDVTGAHRIGGLKKAPLMFGYKFLSNPHTYFLFMKTSELLKYDIRKRFSMEGTMRHTNNEYDYTSNPNNPLESMSNFQGALGLSILSNMDEHMKVRGKNTSILETELSSLENIDVIQKEPGTGRVHRVRYPILVKKGLRKQVLAELLKHGIEASPMYSEYGMDVDADRFPGAEMVSREILTLPCHPGVNEEDLKTTVEVIKKFS